jgi:enterochelin esterase-like enzyme
MKLHVLSVLCALMLVPVASVEAQSSAESPAISALARDIESAKQSAEDVFWRQVAERGTPLIERVNEDPAYVLVTFVWRGDPSTTRVVLAGQLGQLNGTRPSDNELVLLAGTSVWHRSYWLRKDARAAYQLGATLSPNQPVSAANLGADPLNRHKVPGAPISFIELPGAPPEPWVRPSAGTPKGTVHTSPWRSTVLNNERQLRIYTPPGYRTTGEPYALLVTSDGDTIVENLQVPTVLDNLIAAGRIPPMVAVFIGGAAGAQSTRSAELSANEGYVELVVREVVPWMRSTYHVTRDPARTVIGGASLAGLTATFAALRHPDVFGNVISMSGSFWWKPAGDAEGEWLARQFTVAPAMPLKFFISVGLFEAGNNDGAPQDWLQRNNIPYPPSMLVVNRHLRDVLRAKNYPVHYLEVSAGHNPGNWRYVLPEALIALMRPDRP